MIIGYQKQWQFLVKSAELDKLSHAYLFSGPEKLGKKTLALEFIKFLFGQNPTNPPHPDFILITPLNKEIQIDQIRELTWKLSLKPSIAPFKTAVINQAHLMNQEAQNSLLKTLEEPRGKALLILISEMPEYLFPTILSRVQTIKFYPVKKEEIKDYLKKQKISKEMIEEITEFSLGRPGLVIDLISEPKKLTERKEIIKKLIEVSKSDISSRFHYAKDLAKLPNLREILDIWQNYFRNVLLKFLTPEVKQSDYSFLKLKNIVNQIQSTEFLISTTNVNPVLTLEILMLEL